MSKRQIIRRLKYLNTGWMCAWLMACSVFVCPNSARCDGFALVVGVNDCPRFELPDGSRPRPLRGAENDADALRSLLIDELGFAESNVRLLKGADANRTNIELAINQLVKKMRPKDTFLFHFSGHGTRLPDRRPFDEADGLDEALCPADAMADGENLLLDDDLGRLLDLIEARSITVFLDCCHAGTGTKDANDLMGRSLPIAGVPTAVNRQEKPWRELAGTTKGISRSVTTFCACRAEQQAYERRLGREMPVRAGQFSFYLLEGIRNRVADHNGDGALSNREAIDYAARRLDEEFNRTRPSAHDRQEPILEADFAEAPLFGTGTAKAPSHSNETSRGPE